MSDALVIAEKFFRAIEAGDVDAIRAIYAPDAVIWHNNDQLEQSVDDNLRVLGWVAKNLKNRPLSGEAAGRDSGRLSAATCARGRDGERSVFDARLYRRRDQGRPHQPAR